MDTIKQEIVEPVEAYYSRFNQLIKRSEITDNARILFYFKKGLYPDLLPMISLHNPATLQAVRTLVQYYEQGTDFATNAELQKINSLVMKRILKI